MVLPLLLMRTPSESMAVGTALTPVLLVGEAWLLANTGWLIGTRNTYCCPATNPEMTVVLVGMLPAVEYTPVLCKRGSVLAINTTTPLASVVAVATALPARSYSTTCTPALPGSSGSWMPSPSTSSQMRVLVSW